MKLVDIGGYRLATYVAGEGNPPVVFIAEYTGAAAIWDGVCAALQQPCMTVTYDRPGLGNSDDLPGDERARPRTWGQSAEELHRLLALLNVESPRVVVGHSYGALIARAYVEQWPNDVAGLVLSETSDPNLYEDGSFPDWMNYEDDNGRAGTRFDVLTGAKENRSLHPRPDLPTVVVTGAVGRWERAIGKLDEYGGKTWHEIDDLWQANQHAIAQQTQAAQIIAHTAGHQLCVEAPALIARAVDAVVAAVRTGTDIHLDPDRRRGRRGPSRSPLVRGRDPMWTLRSARAGDGPLLRDLRLRALRDAGHAFLETVDQAGRLDAAGWEARIARYTRPGRQVLVVAEDPHAGSWCGMAGAFVDSERDNPEFDLPVHQGDRWAMMWGTYVAPASRGKGMADRLCESLFTWAVEQARVDWLGLHVRDSNSHAIQLYQRQGFHVVSRNFHPALRVTSLVMVRPVM